MRPSRMVSGLKSAPARPEGRCQQLPGSQDVGLKIRSSGMHEVVPAPASVRWATEMVRGGKAEDAFDSRQRRHNQFGELARLVVGTYEIDCAAIRLPTRDP